MTKKIKEVKSEEKLTLDNISIGDKILDLHNEEVEITEDLIEQMRQYEQETKKSVIWRGKITGTFLFYRYVEDHPEVKLKTKKKPGKKQKDVEELIEEEVVNEEDMMLDAMADYKAEFGVKKVNTNTKKFKAFFEEWKQAD